MVANVKVGDTLRRISTYGFRQDTFSLFTVTEVGAKRGKAKEESMLKGRISSGLNEIVFSIPRGKVFGDGSFVSIAEEGLEYWQDHNKKVIDKADQKAKTREEKWQSRLAKARELNPKLVYEPLNDLCLVRFTMGISDGVMFVKSENRQDMYNPENKVVVDFCGFAKTWHSKYGPFHESQKLGPTVNDVIYEWIANNLEV